MKTNLKQYLPELKVISSANPDGSGRKYRNGFNPQGKTQWVNGALRTPAKNTMNAPRTPIEEATVILEMPSKKLKTGTK